MLHHFFNFFKIYKLGFSLAGPPLFLPFLVFFSGSFSPLSFSISFPSCFVSLSASISVSSSFSLIVSSVYSFFTSSTYCFSMGFSPRSYSSNSWSNFSSASSPSLLASGSSSSSGGASGFRNIFPSSNSFIG